MEGPSDGQLTCVDGRTDNGCVCGTDGHSQTDGLTGRADGRDVRGLTGARSSGAAKKGLTERDDIQIWLGNAKSNVCTVCQRAT